MKTDPMPKVCYHLFAAASMLPPNELIINDYRQKKMTGTKQGFFAISL